MNDIVKSFSTVQVLKGVDFSAKHGEIVSILGENGAGKSTLMKILSGAYPAGTYEGTIQIEGETKIIGSPKEAEDSGVVMIYQENNPFLDLSVAENIFMGNYKRKPNRAIDWKTIYKDTEDLLEMMGLDLDPHEKMRKLSGSEQQLVAILKAVSKKAKILILDEPTSSLTQKETEYLFTIIRKLSKEGIACIYISHKLDEVFELSDRIVVLRDGVATGAFHREEFEIGRILEAMLGRRLDEMYPESHHTIGDELLRVEDFKVKHPYNKEKYIVNGMNLSLRKGEILGLAGLVGSGRTELVNSIFGHLKKEAGTVYLDGKEVSIDTPSDAVEMGIGLVVEDRKRNGLVLMHSIKENLTLANLKDISRRSVLNHAKEQQRVDYLFDLMNIKAPSSDTIVGNLSGGNQQKVVMGKWLNTSPKVLILDEPTRGIDVGSKVEIYHQIVKLAQDGVGILIISSEFPELLGLCDRIAVVRHGKNAGEYEKGQIDEAGLLAQVSGIKEAQQGDAANGY